MVVGKGRIWQLWALLFEYPVSGTIAWKFAKTSFLTIQMLFVYINFQRGKPIKNLTGSRKEAWKKEKQKFFNNVLTKQL